MLSRGYQVIRPIILMNEILIIPKAFRILLLLKKSSTPSKIKTSVIEKGFRNFLKHKWDL